MSENDVFEDGVRCWICPDCAFTFSAEHTNTDGSGYTCPLCAVNGMSERLALRLLDEAEIARTSPNGQHPKIPVRTHAAALRFAGDLVRNEEL